MSKSASVIETNHPYIMRSHEVCDGSPVLAGTRTRVVDVVIEYAMLGRSPDEIIDAHPHLNLAMVHDALSYYYENREKLDAEIQSRIQDIDELESRFQSKVWNHIEFL
jgi:uncharacterized protein (DUF433 family)